MLWGTAGPRLMKCGSQPLQAILKLGTPKLSQSKPTGADTSPQGKKGDAGHAAYHVPRHPNNDAESVASPEVSRTAAAGLASRVSTHSPSCSLVPFQRNCERRPSGLRSPWQNRPNKKRPNWETAASDMAAGRQEDRRDRPARLLVCTQP